MKTSNTQLLLPRLAPLYIKIWSLAQGTNTVARSRIVVVICRTMPCAPVVPDSDVILTPSESYLGIVVLCYHIEEVFKEDIRLVFCDAVDALGEALVDVDRVPPSNGYCNECQFYAQ